MEVKKSHPSAPGRYNVIEAQGTGNVQKMTTGKVLETPGSGDMSLKRRITLTSGISIIVGSIIGSGVFVSPGEVLQQAGSPTAALIVWALSGALCTVGALCFRSVQAPS